ncbi:MAG: flagellar hook-associated protein FlgK [Planctomycetes bacterium]|nr:flagellar hook-associated protein FlgK [Planctomycetota bacterium]
MSLFGSIQMAGNTLQAMQIGLHVVGNNIANANTPGYIRERVIFTPAPVQRIGTLTLGTGVKIAGIVQSVDKFVEGRLRDAGSDRASAEVQEKVYRDLELSLGELSDVDISTALSKFFGSIDLVTQTPEDVAVRNLAIAAGVSLTQRINSVERRVRAIHQDLSSRVENIASEINTLTAQIHKLNLQIVTTEGGGSTGSDAGALRSQRNSALKQLAEIANITANEQPTGTINVSINGELLVFEGSRREVSTVLINENGLTRTEIRFADNNSPLVVSGGKLHGIYESRDSIVIGFLDGLDKFASTLAFEFNKVYSQGEGQVGFISLTSVEQVNDPDAVLNAAGLDFTPVNGHFTFNVRNRDSGLTDSHDIFVDLNGLDGDTTLTSLASTLDAINGVSAQVSFNNELVITADSADVEFSFAGDTSGLLAALGVNTFFTGSSARTLGVNQVLRTDVTAGAKFAASASGIGDSADNALRLINLHDTALESLDRGSIAGVYDKLINDTTQGATVSAAVADGLRVFEGTLEATSQSISGVSLDEEAIDMILLQRTYQASARYISTLTDLMDLLVNL